jgi:hypothetical protein
MKKIQIELAEITHYRPLRSIPDAMQIKLECGHVTAVFGNTNYLPPSIICLFCQKEKSAGN